MAQFLSIGVCITVQDEAKQSIRDLSTEYNYTLRIADVVSMIHRLRFLGFLVAGSSIS